MLEAEMRTGVDLGAGAVLVKPDADRLHDGAHVHVDGLARVSQGHDLSARSGQGAAVHSAAELRLAMREGQQHQEWLVGGLAPQ